MDPEALSTSPLKLSRGSVIFFGSLAIVAVACNILVLADYFAESNPSYELTSLKFKVNEHYMSALIDERLERIKAEVASMQKDLRDNYDGQNVPVTPHDRGIVKPLPRDFEGSVSNDEMSWPQWVTDQLTSINTQVTSFSSTVDSAGSTVAAISNQVAVRAGEQNGVFSFVEPECTGDPKCTKTIQFKIPFKEKPTLFFHWTLDQDTVYLGRGSNWVMPGSKGCTISTSTANDISYPNETISVSTSQFTYTVSGSSIGLGCQITWSAFGEAAPSSS